MLEGWIDKASKHLQIAKQHSESIYNCSETIEAAQECLELSGKSILSLFNIKFSHNHGWAQDKKQFAEIATQIQKRQIKCFTS